LIPIFFLMLACARDEGQPPPPAGQPAGPPHGQQAGAPPPPAGMGEGATAPPAAEATTPPRERILGAWTMALTEAQQRQYRLLELAFRDPPPSADELARLDLDQSEQLMLTSAMAGRAQDPNDPSIAELRRGLEELASANLEVTGERLVFTFAEEREEATYTVASEENGVLVLHTVTPHEGGTVAEDVQVTFEGEDKMSLLAQGDPEAAPQVFVRRKPVAAAP
jgi:hypothetical protein